MMAIHEAGRGVLVLIREPSPTSISDRIKASLGQPAAVGPGALPLRDYGIGAQILKDLGVRDMILLSNVERPIVGLEGYGLRVVEQRRLCSRSDLVTPRGAAAAEPSHDAPPARPSSRIC